MAKDPRYQGIKALIELGKIKLFSQIFEEHKFPVTTLALFLGTNHTRLTKYINNPALFTFGEAGRIAGYFEVDDTVMHRLIHEDMLAKRASKKNAAPRKKSRG